MDTAVARGLASAGWDSQGGMMISISLYHRHDDQHDDHDDHDDQHTWIQLWREE